MSVFKELLERFVEYIEADFDKGLRPAPPSWLLVCGMIPLGLGVFFLLLLTLGPRDNGLTIEEKIWLYFLGPGFSLVGIVLIGTGVSRFMQTRRGIEIRSRRPQGPYRYALMFSVPCFYLIARRVMSGEENGTVVLLTGLVIAALVASYLWFRIRGY
jgi:hypothetical protein